MTSIGNNTAAIYLRKSTEDDGKSVAVQNRKVSTGVPASTSKPDRQEPTLSTVTYQG